MKRVAVEARHSFVAVFLNSGRCGESRPAIQIEDEEGRTCMTSRSCTYFRSVSTSSLIILARAPPDSTTTLVVLSDVRDSVDPRETNVGDDGVDVRKRSSGNCCTRLITLLTT